MMLADRDNDAEISDKAVRHAPGGPSENNLNSE